MKNYILFFSILGLLSSGVVFAQMTTAVNPEAIKKELGDLCADAPSCSFAFERAFNSGDSATVQRFINFGLKNKLYSSGEAKIVTTAPIETIVHKANEITQCGNDTICIVQRAQELIRTASRDQNLSKAINQSEFTRTTEAIIALNRSARNAGITLEKCVDGESLSDDEEIACSKLLRAAAKQSKTINAVIPDINTRLEVAQRTENTDALASYIAQNGCTPLHPEIKTMDQCGIKLQDAFASGNPDAIKAFKALAISAGPEYARQFSEMERNFNKKLSQYVATTLPSEEYVLIGDAMVPIKDMQYRPEGKYNTNYPYNATGGYSMAAGCQNKYQNNPEKLKMCIQMAEEIEQPDKRGIYPPSPNDYRCPAIALMYPRPGCSYSLTEKTSYALNGIQCETPKLICNDNPPIYPVTPVYPKVPSQPPYDVLGKKFDTITGALSFCRSIAPAVPVPMCMALEAQNNNVPSVDCAAMPFTVLADFEIVRNGQTITDQGRRDAMAKYASCAAQPPSPGRSYLDIYRGGLYKLGGVWEACMNRLGNAADRSLIQNDLRENREPSWGRLSAKGQIDTAICEKEAGYTSQYVPPGTGGIGIGSCPAPVLTLLNNDTSCHRMDFSYSDSVMAAYSGAYMTAGMSGPYILIKKDGTSNGTPEGVVKNCTVASERISLCTGGSILPIDTGQPPPAGQREQIWNTYGLRSWVRTDADQARITELKEICKNVPQYVDVWMAGAGNMISLDFGMPDPAKCRAYAVLPPPPPIPYPLPGSGGMSSCTPTEIAAFQNGGISPASDCHYMDGAIPYAGAMSACLKNGVVSRDRANCPSLMAGNYSGTAVACTPDRPYHWSGDVTGRCITAAECTQGSGTLSGTVCTPPPYMPSGGGALTCPAGSSWSGSVCMSTLGLGAPSCPTERSYMCNNVCSITPCSSTYTPPPSPGSCGAGMYWYTPPGGSTGYCKSIETYITPTTCPSGQYWNGYSCITSSTSTTGQFLCPNGSYVAVGTACPTMSAIPTSCPPGYTGVPPNCAISGGIYTTPPPPTGTYTPPTSCPTGYYLSNGACMPSSTTGITSSTCPAGYTGTPPNCIVSGSTYIPPPTGTYTTQPNCMYGGVYPACNPMPSTTSSTMTPDEGCKQTYGSAASWNGTKCIGGTSPTASIIDIFRSWFGRQ